MIMLISLGPNGQSERNAIYGHSLASLGYLSLVHGILHSVYRSPHLNLIYLIYIFLIRCSEIEFDQWKRQIYLKEVSKYKTPQQKFIQSRVTCCWGIFVVACLPPPSSKSCLSIKSQYGERRQAIAWKSVVWLLLHRQLSLGLTCTMSLFFMYE